MSSSQLDIERKKKLEDLKKIRVKDAKMEILASITHTLIPQLLAMNNFSTLIDLSLKIDRKKLLIECLRESADKLEGD